MPNFAPGLVLRRFLPPLLLLALLAACAVSPPPPPAPPPERATFSETGIASWYGPHHQGRLTANGERFDQRELTAANRNLPFDTVLRVTAWSRSASTIAVLT